MTMSLVADDGFAATICLGWADLTAHTPVRPDHLFEIGSISKSLVALTLWNMADAGLIDLNAPVSRYLPATLLPPEPITTLQILNHVAGLPNGAPPVPHVAGERLWIGATPGSKFYYSNTGYQLLGLLISALAKRPHATEIMTRALRPIGMTDAAAVITSADRARLAQGYSVQRDDLMPLTGTTLAEGFWNEMDMAAGSVIATPDDMAAYLRFVIALGRGRGAPLLRDESAKALIAAQVDADEFGPKARYASGFATVVVEERPLLHHTGGMMQFASSFHVDSAEGVGAFASVNGIYPDYRPRAVTAFAARALRAARAGKPLPDAPNPMAFRTVSAPDRFVGRWVAADGHTIELARSGNGLAMVDGARRGRIEAAGGTKLMSNLPGWDAGPLEFSAPGKGKDAPLDRLWYRDLALARVTAPAAVSTPDRLAALAGKYRTNDAWVGPIDIVARGDRLEMLGYGPLIEDARGFWRLEEDAGGLERLRFDQMVGGKAQRLSFSGHDLWRMG
jgi:CubicO group peptidase (beta-lactamase class C family)